MRELEPGADPWTTYRDAGEPHGWLAGVELRDGGHLLQARKDRSNG